MVYIAIKRHHADMDIFRITCGTVFYASDEGIEGNCGAGGGGWEEQYREGRYKGSR